jgi:uncharacterized membrane protein YkvA (DUF1232 family)
MTTLTQFAHRLRVDAHAMWLAARDPAVPLPVRIFGMAIAAYALSPIDLIPDFIPVLGLLDDLIILPLGLWLFRWMIRDEIFAHHRAVAEEASHRPVSRAGMVVIGAIWVMGLAWVVLLLLAGRYY